MLGTEGARRFSFTLRNVGTAACPATQIATALPGVRSGALGAGLDRAGPQRDRRVRRRRACAGTKSGTRPALAFQAQSAEDVSTANNSVSSAPLVVRAG